MEREEGKKGSGLVIKKGTKPFAKKLDWDSFEKLIYESEITVYLVMNRKVKLKLWKRPF